MKKSFRAQMVKIFQSKIGDLGHLLSDSTYEEPSHHSHSQIKKNLDKLKTNDLDLLENGYYRVKCISQNLKKEVHAKRHS